MKQRRIKPKTKLTDTEERKCGTMAVPIRIQRNFCMEEFDSTNFQEKREEKWKQMFHFLNIETQPCEKIGSPMENEGKKKKEKVETNFPPTTGCYHFKS